MYRADLSKRGGKGNAMLLEAYGAYGLSMDPGFDPHRLSLLDRGFVYALAHPRGGGELGEYWHVEGMLLKKRNTFTDVIAVVEHLIQVTAVTAPISLPIAQLSLDRRFQANCTLCTLLILTGQGPSVCRWCLPLQYEVPCSGALSAAP